MQYSPLTHELPEGQFASCEHAAPAQTFAVLVVPSLYLHVTVAQIFVWHVPAPWSVGVQLSPGAPVSVSLLEPQAAIKKIRDIDAIIERFILLPIPSRLLCAHCPGPKCWEKRANLSSPLRDAVTKISDKSHRIAILA